MTESSKLAIKSGTSINTFGATYKVDSKQAWLLPINENNLRCQKAGYGSLKDYFVRKGTKLNKWKDTGLIKELVTTTGELMTFERDFYFCKIELHNDTNSELKQNVLSRRSSCSLKKIDKVIKPKRMRSLSPIRHTLVKREESITGKIDGENKNSHACNGVCYSIHRSKTVSTLRYYKEIKPVTEERDHTVSNTTTALPVTSGKSFKHISKLSLKKSSEANLSNSASNGSSDQQNIPRKSMNFRSGVRQNNSPPANTLLQESKLPNNAVQHTSRSHCKSLNSNMKVKVTNSSSIADAKYYSDSSTSLAMFSATSSLETLEGKKESLLRIDITSSSAESFFDSKGPENDRTRLLHDDTVAEEYHNGNKNKYFSSKIYNHENDEQMNCTKPLLKPREKMHLISFSKRRRGESRSEQSFEKKFAKRLLKKTKKADISFVDMRESDTGRFEETCHKVLPKQRDKTYFDYFSKNYEDDGEEEENIFEKIPNESELIHQSSQILEGAVDTSKFLQQSSNVRCLSPDASPKGQIHGKYLGASNELTAHLSSIPSTANNNENSIHKCEISTNHGWSTENKNLVAKLFGNCNRISSKFGVIKIVCPLPQGNMKVLAVSSKAPEKSVHETTTFTVDCYSERKKISLLDVKSAFEDVRSILKEASHSLEFSSEPSDKQAMTGSDTLRSILENSKIETIARSSQRCGDSDIKMVLPTPLNNSTDDTINETGCNYEEKENYDEFGDIDKSKEKAIITIIQLEDSSNDTNNEGCNDCNEKSVIANDFDVTSSNTAVTKATAVPYADTTQALILLNRTAQKENDVLNEDLRLKRTSPDKIRLEIKAKNCYSYFTITKLIERPLYVDEMYYSLLGLTPEFLGKQLKHPTDIKMILSQKQKYMYALAEQGYGRSLMQTEVCCDNKLIRTPENKGEHETANDTQCEISDHITEYDVDGKSPETQSLQAHPNDNDYDSDDPSVYEDALE